MAMNNARKVRMRIVEIKKKCPRGHQVGEQWLVDGTTPGGICMGSFGSCLPYLTALRFGASFPWEKREGRITVGCPDPVNQVVWQLDRLEEESAADRYDS
jgi:uncharacterized repeat protein (TIGR04076 family)